MKLWEKGTTTHQMVEDFTIGNDKEFDRLLAPFDVLGTMAHITMLESVGLLKKNELDKLLTELKELYLETSKSEFHLEPNVEDIHSHIELKLTEKLGDVGKKVHSGRSRNDQVLVDIKLFLRHEIKEVVSEINALFNTLLELAEQHKNVLLPGYTHLQIAMPSSFGLWFGAYAESLTDDLEFIKAAYNIANQNPLGSAAGYGSSFPIDRELTTKLLGFKTMAYNVVYAQMGRGKTEQSVAMALGALATTLSKMAMDMCLYNSQNFEFVRFPDAFTTGSSIMPHKKNPDVWELVRGKCNNIKSLPNSILLMTSNLPSGYHRDLQLLKEQLFPALSTIKSCLEISRLMLDNIEVKTDILEDKKYNYLFSVEEVNRMVESGVPFRDAYKKVASSIEDGDYSPQKSVKHTHAGSIGNLCLAEIKSKYDNILGEFDFDTGTKAIQNLIG